MYIAQYGGGEENFVSIALWLPRFEDDPAGRSPAWGAAYLEAVRGMLDCDGSDIGFRVDSDGSGSIRRLLLLSGPETARGAIVRACLRFERLNELVEGSVVFPVDRSAHDGLVQGFARERWVLSTSPSRVRGCAVACDTRAWGSLGELFAAVRSEPCGVCYQVNFGRNRADPEDLRQLRKNLNRLADQPGIPAALLEHQAGLVARFADASWLGDEYLGIMSGAPWPRLRRVLEIRFQHQFGPLGFHELPLTSDATGQFDDLLSSGLHSSRAVDPGPFARAAAAVSSDDVLRVLTWRPERDRTRPIRKIFISYRRDDSQYVVQTLYDYLSRHFEPARIFVDFRSIPLGAEFRHVIKTEGSRADIVIAVIGRRWMTGESGRRRIDDEQDYVRNEIEAALRRGIPLIPILIDGASMPPPGDLPESLRGLPSRNGMSLRPGHDFDHDLERLVGALDVPSNPPQDAAPRRMARGTPAGNSDP
jgi:hypothetical protein